MTLICSTVIYYTLYVVRGSMHGLSFMEYGVWNMDELGLYCLVHGFMDSRLRSERERERKGKVIFS